MRVVSLVPSLTETLITHGADLVGRSRYCIHPQAEVNKIPAVGGTKQADWDEIAQLGPDLVILDREENTRDMAENCPVPFHAVHITGIEDVGPELQRLSEATELPALQAAAARWDAVAARPPRPGGLESLPGVLDWWRRPEGKTRVEYLIWRNPWLAIGPRTFIHSVLVKMGLSGDLISHDAKYPEVDLEKRDPARTTLLFSSEPYPFARYRENLLELGFSCALVDGEAFSWYGIRSLLFLEKNL